MPTNNRFRATGKLLLCTKCNDIIKNNIKAINKHLNKCEVGKRVGFNLYKCKKCKLEFLSKVLAKKHLFDVHFDDLFIQKHHYKVME